MRKFALLVLVVVFGWSSGVAAAPIEWTVASGGNGHFYEVFVQSGVDWNSARTASLALGADWDLASVTSQAEQDFIVSLLPAAPSETDQFWLGGNDINTEGVWEWSNGDAFTYQHWIDGEPNNYFSGEDQLTMFYGPGGGTEWAWNDAGNESWYLNAQIKGYVAEQFVAPIPEPNTALLLGIGMMGLGMRRRRQRTRRG